METLKLWRGGGPLHKITTNRGSPPHFLVFDANLSAQENQRGFQYIQLGRRYVAWECTPYRLRLLFLIDVVLLHPTPAHGA